MLRSRTILVCKTIPPAYHARQYHQPTMHHTPSLRVPVLTFLSRSPCASRRSKQFIERLTGIEPLDFSSNSRRRDELDASTFSSALLSRYSFDSVSSICPRSRVAIHLLSISNGEAHKEKSESDTGGAGNACNNVLTLLSVTDDGSSITEAAKSVQQSRDYLSKLMKGGGGILLGAQLAMRTSTDDKYPIEAHHLLDGDLPKLDVSSLSQHEMSTDNVSFSQYQSKSGMRGIRELVIPIFDSSGIQSQLSSCSVLTRPKIGLYKWPAGNNEINNGLVIRPLPSAAEDRELSPPSLVFQCDNLEACVDTIGKSNGTGETRMVIAKVGFSGCGRGGQFMMRNNSLNGLDIRLCEAMELSSSFAEAQEALLAASLDELQSVNIMNEGGDDGKHKNGKSQQEGGSDAMNGLGDCWVEFRANVKKPGGFFGRKGGIAGGERRAKAPDIPYE